MEDVMLIASEEEVTMVPCASIVIVNEAKPLSLQSLGLKVSSALIIQWASNDLSGFVKKYLSGHSSSY